MERTLADHREKWNINENLLQSYRQIFTGSQAVFLAVGTFLAAESAGWLLYPVAGVGLLMIWFVWYRVVRVRHLLVDYHKYLYDFLVDHYQLPEGICTEFEYLESSQARLKTNRALGLNTNWRLTRVKMDVILPAVYSLVWFLLVFYGLVS